MDTIRCVDNDPRFWDGDEIIPWAGNQDSIGLYCILKEEIDLPIVRVNDENIIHFIDSTLTYASKDGYLQFPDSSGYFVELLINDDSLMFDMSISPIPNYHMARILASDNDEMLLEWYGHKEKYLHGCFFLNDILYVVASYYRVNYKKVSCLFPQTQSTIILKLYAPIVTIVSNSKWATFHHHLYDCDSLKNSSNHNVE